MLTNNTVTNYLTRPEIGTKDLTGNSLCNMHCAHNGHNQQDRRCKLLADR